MISSLFELNTYSINLETILMPTSTDTATLAAINIYPIKSTAGLSLSNAWIDHLGLACDRRFVLSDPQGKFITARTQPKLCLVQAHLLADGLILTAPNMPELIIRYQSITAHYQTVTVWHDDIQAQCCPNDINQWFSDYLQQSCQLLFFGEHSTRPVKNSNKQVAFADGYPLLVISQASLDALNARSARVNIMAQFRPNLVVDNCPAFAEDSWQKIKIGDVEFEVSKPCSRCIFTTVDPKTGEFDKSREPLTSLAKFRKGDDGEVYFGQNLIPLNMGKIKTGDAIKVLSHKVADSYSEQATEQTHRKNFSDQPLTRNNFDTLSPDQHPISQTLTQTPQQEAEQSMSKKVNIVFESWNISHQGNKQDTLLEQGEEAGLIMHYSCRGGNCGRCKVKLQSGEVEQLATDGLMPDEQADGYILACSSIPKSDLVITKN